MRTDLSSFSVLNAPEGWRVIELISDLHLQAAEPLTFKAWQHYMGRTTADAVFILGDLFDVWVGDDGLMPSQAEDNGAGDFESQCADILRDTSRRCPVFFMHGNRDFLFGEAAARRCGLTLLDDPTALRFANQTWLLSHGDALCLADTEYQAFRQTVRTADWQRDFLAKPLQERRALAQAMRQQSLAHQQAQSAYADADAALSLQWLHAAGAATLIHGHTHRPADHDLGTEHTRVVLSDWDAAASPPRSQVLRLSLRNGAAQRQRLSVEQASIA
jgi:UDP-2,3-diacylglucosamine hydrolase